VSKAVNTSTKYVSISTTKLNSSLKKLNASIDVQHRSEAGSYLPSKPSGTAKDRMTFLQSVRKELFPATAPKSMLKMAKHIGKSYGKSLLTCVIMGKARLI
jgi:hypothetical protein